MTPLPLLLLVVLALLLVNGLKYKRHNRQVGESPVTGEKLTTSLPV